MANIKILIAAHKKYPFPKSDIFLPIQVGRKIAKHKLDIQGDDEGDNISEKNPNYCELTALYWAYKNLKIDIIGLFHYRRYLNFNKNHIFQKDEYRFNKNSIHEFNISSEKIVNTLKKFDIILAKPKKYPFSLEISYCIYHIREDLDITREIIKSNYPLYLKTWDQIIKMNNKIPAYNIFISKKETFDAYIKWLFEILTEIEKQIKLSPYKYQQRALSFLSERLLFLYCKKNKLKIKYVPISYFDDVDINNSIKKRTLINYYLKNLLYDFRFYIGNPKAILYRFLVHNQ